MPAVMGTQSSKQEVISVVVVGSLEEMAKATWQ